MSHQNSEYHKLKFSNNHQFHNLQRTGIYKPQIKI